MEIKEALIVLTATQNGKIASVIKNSLEDKINLKKDDLIANYIDKKDYENFLNFLDNVRKKDAILNTNINIQTSDNSINCFISGAILEKEIIILIGQSRTKSMDFFNELIKINNEQTNIIRKQKKENFKKQINEESNKENFSMSGQDENYFKKLTKLNNELTNLQRKLEKKNLQLNFEKNKLNTTIKNIPEGVISTDNEGSIKIFNSSAQNILSSFNNLEDKNIRDIFDIVDINSKKPAFKKIEEILKNKKKRVNSKKVLLKIDNKNAIPIRFSATPIIENNRVNGLIITFKDISEKLKREKEIRRLSLALKNINDSIIITDKKYNIEYVNQNFLKTYKYKEDEIIGLDIDVLKTQSAENNNLFLETNTIKNYHKTKNGIKFPVSISKASIKDEQNQNTGYVFVVKDITEIKKLNDKLKENAIFDSLTNALNKKAGLTFLHKQIEEIKRHGGNLLIIFIDMNNLKKINDTHGHNEGDFAIKKLSSILKNSLRESDILCRYGGDEFFIVLTHCNKCDYNNFWNRIKSKLDNFNKNSKKNYKLSISKGIIDYSQNKNLSVQELIDKADKKMYKEKEIFHNNSE